MTAHAAPASAGSSSNKIARYAPVVARVLLGLGFFAAGVMGLLIVAGVITPPEPNPPMGEAATAFNKGMFASHYLFPLIKVTETTCGALLLSNRFVPLALTILAPVLVNIVLFHGLLAPSGVAPGAVLMLLEIYLGYAYRDAFRGMLGARNTPRA